VTDIDVAAARRPDEALAEITRRSGRLRWRRRAAQAVSSATIVVIVALAVGANLDSRPSSLRTGPAADDTPPADRRPGSGEDGTGGGYLGLQTDHGFVGVGDPKATTTTTVPRAASQTTSEVPDAGWIAFAQRRAPDRYDRDLVVARADGSSRRRVLEAPAGYVYGSPAWSPNGHQLAFTYYYDMTTPMGVGVVNADGPGSTRWRSR
jgi:hypothetical protein